HVLFAVGFLCGRRHLPQRAPVRADEPRPARPTAVRVLAGRRTELGIVQPGVIVQRGVHLELSDPAVRPRPGGAELVPPGARAARRVRVRTVDELGAVIDQGLQVLAVRAVGADRDAHLDAHHVEYLMLLAGLAEALLFREPDLAVQADDPPL